MVLVLNGPLWFRGYEMIFVFVSALITLLIGLLSYKAYKLTQEEKYRYFSLAFFALFVSHLILSVFIGVLITHSNQFIYNTLMQFDYIFLIHIALIILAYALLLITTLKVEERKHQALVLVLAFLLTLFSYQHFLKFHVVSLFMVGLLAYQFYMNSIEKQTGNAKLVFGSFYFLFIAEIFMILQTYITDTFFVVARVLQFIGFLMLFYTLLKVTEHGRQKREIRHN